MMGSASLVVTYLVFTVLVAVRLFSAPGAKSVYGIARECGQAALAPHHLACGCISGGHTKRFHIFPPDALCRPRHVLATPARHFPFLVVCLLHALFLVRRLPSQVVSCCPHLASSLLLGLL